MRVVLTVSDSTARLRQLVPLGWALRTGGFDVHIAASPGFAHEITTAGFVAIPLSTVDGLAALLPRWNVALVVWDEGSPWGAEAAELAGISAVRFSGVLGEAPGPGIDVLPPSLRPDGGDLRMRHVPYSGASVLPAWLHRKARRPRIFFTGTLSAELMEQLGALPAEVICELPADRVPAGLPIPGNLRLFDAVSREALLPTCAGVVHDGDAVVTADAVVHGLPQVVLSEGSVVAQRVLEYGAATRDLRQLLDDGLKARAAELGAEAAALPSPGEMAQRLVRAAAA